MKRKRDGIFAMDRERPTAFANPFAEQRQAVSRLHPRSPVNIADFDGARFGPVIIAGVENPHSPRPEFFTTLRWRMSLEPTHARGSKAAQPVVLINRLGQLLFGSPQRLIQTAPVIGKHCAERQFDRRAGTRPSCQHIDQIEQNRTAGSQIGGDSVSEFLYTFRRGSFFFHTTSLSLVYASREAERPPFICPNSWS